MHSMCIICRSVYTSRMKIKWVLQNKQHYYVQTHLAIKAVTVPTLPAVSDRIQPAAIFISSTDLSVLFTHRKCPAILLRSLYLDPYN